MAKIVKIAGFISYKVDGEHDYAVSVNDEILAEKLEPIIDEKQVSVRYWICADKMSQEEANEAFQLHLFGGKASALYSPIYSEITGYLWTDEELRVGGHDLLKELDSFIGKYLILEIEVHD